MGKQALRWLLGVGYVVLVTLLLLYQMGVVGKPGNTVIVVLGTLVLGIALAVVLALYIRVTDQMKEQAAEAKNERKEQNQEPRSYEEIYADFLKATQDGGLSERELEVAWLLYRGYTNRQIGEELYIAETTVKKHVSHIYQKMEVYSRKEFRGKVKSLTLPQTTPLS
ncbi:DNA-binding response regulator [bacterium 0.1xD8-71]|nr:DNA-binding response regulator [bacterium 0.1xD8-71]